MSDKCPSNKQLMFARFTSQLVLEPLVNVIQDDRLAWFSKRTLNQVLYTFRVINNRYIYM